MAIAGKCYQLKSKKIVLLAFSSSELLSVIK